MAEGRKARRISWDEGKLQAAEADARAADRVSAAVAQTRTFAPLPQRAVEAPVVTEPASSMPSGGYSEALRQFRESAVTA
jgi:hypothetical protein